MDHDSSSDSVIGKKYPIELSFTDGRPSIMASRRIANTIGISNRAGAILQFENCSKESGFFADLKTLYEVSQGKFQDLQLVDDYYKEKCL